MEIWNKYEKCKSYIEENGLINRTNEQWDFVLDNQWNVGQNTPLSTGSPLPFFNIIKSSIKFQLSTIASNQMIPTFNYTGQDEDEDILAAKIQISKSLNIQLHSDWKKSKQKTKSWNVIKQGLIQGDSYQYCGTADPKDDQIIMNTNIMFGDEANNSIQEQPYIIIRERLLVEDVKKAALKSGIDNSDVLSILADTDDQYLINNTISKDVEGKVTSILYMEKRDGVVWWGKAVKGLDYMPLRPLESSVGDTKVPCRLYPIASYLPEEAPNSARGKSFVRPMIPNQISINKLLARRDESTKMCAFPIKVANANYIRNLSDLEKVGSTILTDSPGTVKDVLDYINPVNQSTDAQDLLNDLMKTTRELNGSIDSLTGATDPTRVSGQAVYAMVAQSEKPLNEPVDRYKQFIEDLTLIWLEQKRVYYPNGFEVDGLYIDGEALRDIDLEVSIDISQDTPWTRAAEKAFIDDLLDKQLITLEQYVELAPDNSEVPKGKLKKMFKEQPEVTQPTEVTEPEVTDETPM